MCRFLCFSSLCLVCVSRMHHGQSFSLVPLCLSSYLLLHSFVLRLSPSLCVSVCACVCMSSALPFRRCVILLSLCARVKTLSRISIPSPRLFLSLNLNLPLSVPRCMSACASVHEVHGFFYALRGVACLYPSLPAVLARLCGSLFCVPGWGFRLNSSRTAACVVRILCTSLRCGMSPRRAMTRRRRLRAG